MYTVIHPFQSNRSKLSTSIFVAKSHRFFYKCRVSYFFRNKTFSIKSCLKFDCDFKVKTLKSVIYEYKGKRIHFFPEKGFFANHFLLAFLMLGKKVYELLKWSNYFSLDFYSICCRKQNIKAFFKKLWNFEWCHTSRIHLFLFGKLKVFQPFLLF